MKFGNRYAGRHLQVLWLRVKISPLGASAEISSSQFLFWDPLHISVTNGARKLKFGILVGQIVTPGASTRKYARCNNLSAGGGVWENQELPLFILGPLISPKLIELES